MCYYAQGAVGVENSRRAYGDGKVLDQKSFLEEVMVRVTVATANLYKRLIMCQALFQTL